MATLLTETRGEHTYRYLAERTADGEYAVMFQSPSGCVENAHVGTRPSIKALSQWFGRWYALHGSGCTEWFEFNDREAQDAYDTTRARLAQRDASKSDVSTTIHERLDLFKHERKEQAREAFAQHKPKFRKARITLALPEDWTADRTVEAFCYQGLAIHKPIKPIDQSYQISHVASGMSLAKVSTQSEARLAVWRLSHIMDWTRDKQEIVADCRSRYARGLLRDAS